MAKKYKPNQQGRSLARRNRRRQRLQSKKYKPNQQGFSQPNQQGFSRSIKWVVIGCSSLIILSMVLSGINFQ